MHPGGWTAAARFAGAEPLWTGRARPYDESTLRRVADCLEAEGGAAHVAAVLRRQVDCAVRATGDPVVAYTDVFDQPWYTKAPARRAEAVLDRAWALEVPYLTIGRQRAELWRFRAPTARNDAGLPITVRADARLGGTVAAGPWGWWCQPTRRTPRRPAASASARA